MLSPESAGSTDSVYEDADAGLGILSEDKIQRIRADVGRKCEIVTEYLHSSRGAGDKKKLVVDTIQDLASAFNLISTAYLKLSSNFSLAKSIRQVVAKSVREVVGDTMGTAACRQDSSVGDTISYATMAARGAKTVAPKIKVARGPTLAVPRTTSIVIGPKSGAESNLASSSETCDLIMKTVKPKEVNLKVNRIVNLKSKNVKIIAEAGDFSKLKDSPALEAAGLEVKQKDRLHPRMVIRGVPDDMSNDQLQKQVIENNFKGVNFRPDFKVVYRYPKRDNRSDISVVIETPPEMRKYLLNQGKIFLAWRACGVEDHLKVLQCFKCLGFRHFAKNCPNAARCGRCAGEHETKACPKKSSDLKCHNCASAKLQDNHSAFDAAKCSILRRRLVDKAKNINYNG